MLNNIDELLNNIDEQVILEGCVRDLENLLLISGCRGVTLKM